MSHGGAAFDRENAIRTVRRLSGRAFGGRRATTAGHERARRWIERRLTSWGYAVQRHSFHYPISIVDVAGRPTGWVSRRGSRHRPIDYRRDFAEHPASGPARAPLVGRCVPWEPGAEFRGRWAVSSAEAGSPPLGRQVAEAAQGMAIGFLIPFSVAPGEVIFKQLPAGVPFPLPTFFLRRELLGSVATSEVALNVRVRRKPLVGTNLLAELAGSDPKMVHRPVLLGAHYDAVGDDPDGRRFPGASDNASGVAVVLEIARLVRERRAPFRRPVWFAAFDAEETGAYGARALAREFRHSGVAPMVVNIDLSAVEGPPVAVEGSANASRLLRALDRAGKRTGVALVHGTIPSDHRQFASAGFPSVGVASGGRGYHTPSDGPENVHAAALARSGTLLLAALAGLAG